MAIERNIIAPHFLDKIDPLDTIPEKLAGLQSAGNVTGWAEVKDTNEAIQSLGRLSAEVNHRNVNGTIRPAVGYYGDTFYEGPTITGLQTFEYIGGYEYFEVISLIKLTATPNKGTAAWTVILNGQTSGKSQGYTAQIGTGEYLYVNRWKIPGAFANQVGNGQAGIATWQVSYQKSGPKAQTGKGNTYYEGVIWAKLFLQKYI